MELCLVLPEWVAEARALGPSSAILPGTVAESWGWEENSCDANVASSRLTCCTTSVAHECFHQTVEQPLVWQMAKGEGLAESQSKAVADARQEPQLLVWAHTLLSIHQ